MILKREKNFFEQVIDPYLKDETKCKGNLCKITRQWPENESV